MILHNTYIFHRILESLMPSTIGSVLWLQQVFYDLIQPRKKINGNTPLGWNVREQALQHAEYSSEQT